MVQLTPLGSSHGSKIRILIRPSWAMGLAGVFPPTLTYEIITECLPISQFDSLTIVPLLRNPPAPHKLSVIRFKGVAVLVWKFQRAPHAVWLFILSGSLVALSKNIARVGETTIASSARMPDVPFWTNSQPAPSARGTLAIAKESAKRLDEKGILVQSEGCGSRAMLS